MRSSVSLLIAGAVLAIAAPSPKILPLKGLIRNRPAPADLLAQIETVKVANFATENTTETEEVTAPYKNVWHSLSTAEAAQVVSFLHNQTELNLTAAADADTWSNWIGALDLVPPNKTDVLDWIDGKASEPSRFAKVILQFQATDEPYLEEMVVGPIEADTSSMTYRPYTEGSTRVGSIRQRNYDADADLVYAFIEKQCSQAAGAIKSLLGADWSEFDLWGIDPLWHEEVDGDERVMYWIGFWGIPTTLGDFETLLPQGLYMKIDQTSRDPKNWKLVGWLYGGTYYRGTSAFLAAFDSPSFETYTRNEGVDGSWAMTDNKGAALPLDSRAPPMQILPEGKRWKVDADAKYVVYGDFSFFIGFTRDTGVRLFDIKYKGERIIYELGLQEALAHYAGNDPVQSGTGYIDSYYGFGPYAFELLAGFDCPSYATFLNATFHANEISTTHPAAICLFESDMGTPIQRHSSSAYVSATKGLVFTMRSVSTVGNYDYSFDFNFMGDGSIEVVVRASGYIQSAYYAKNDDYGYQIHDGLSGSMHDHALNFKVDFDILGTKNTLVKHEIVKADVLYDWSNTTRSTMKLQRSNVTNEDEGKLNWAHNAQEMIMVVNHDEKNKFGEPRGYRIMPSRGGAGMHLTVTNSSNLFNSQGFADHALYVTKRKDEENAASHSCNSYDPRNPIIDFSKYFDGEDLVQEDLVLWFNLGMHHVPHTGDIPNTVHTTAQSGMIISPHNYLYSDPSRQTKQMIRLDYNSSDSDIVSTVKTFGSSQPEGSFNLTAISTDYYAYVGDSATRKFPFDPLHPYNETISIV